MTAVNSCARTVCKTGIKGLTFSILNRYLDGSPLPPDWQVFPMASSKNIFDSSVRLARVEPKHSGQYECQPSPLQSAIINLHVVKGIT